jgi:hypothetical protein
MSQQLHPVALMVLKGIDRQHRVLPKWRSINIFGCFPFSIIPFFTLSSSHGFDPPPNRIHSTQNPTSITPWPIEFAPLKGLLLLQTGHEIGFPSVFVGMGPLFPLAWGNLGGLGLFIHLELEFE